MEETARQKQCVLVVDDEPAIGKVLGIKLNLAGYDVITTTSGAEAIELVRKENPDIMLLDIVMPDVTGFDVLQSIRTFSELPIIVFTARQDNFKTAMGMGASDFINKPFQPDILVEKIRHMLDLRSQKHSGNGSAP